MRAACLSEIFDSIDCWPRHAARDPSVASKRAEAQQVCVQLRASADQLNGRGPSTPLHVAAAKHPAGS